jgi:hypothetical protein
MSKTRLVSWLALLVPVFVGAVNPTPKAQAKQADRLHAKAVEMFRQGRFPEAYGRFIELANAGHPASARYALWMCEQGPALFGKEWDCAPHEVEDWARLAGVPVPSIVAGPSPATRRVVHPAPR